MHTPWFDLCSTSTLLDTLLDSRELPPTVELVELVEAVEELAVEVAVVAVEPPQLKA